PRTPGDGAAGPRCPHPPRPVASARRSRRTRAAPRRAGSRSRPANRRGARSCRSLQTETAPWWPRLGGARGPRELTREGEPLGRERVQVARGPAEALRLLPIRLQEALIGEPDQDRVHGARLEAGLLAEVIAVAPHLGLGGKGEDHRGRLRRGASRAFHA